MIEWEEEYYSEPSGLIVHKTIAVVDDWLAYVRHNVYTPHFIQCSLPGKLEEDRQKRVKSILAEMTDANS